MFGHVLVLAGSLRYSGAAIFCAEGALRGGAGLVTVGLPESIARPILKVKPPEAMLLPLPETKEGTLGIPAFKEIATFALTADVLALGPGLGVNESIKKIVRRIIGGIEKPLVLDASALAALKGDTGILRKKKAPLIITPHPGEMAMLTGLTINQIQNNRKDIAKKVAYEYNITVVLKGMGTVVAFPGNPLYINTTGNPGMARGGTGDILTGMIAAFVGQGLKPFEAAKYAVYLHGLAGDMAAREKTQVGMIASDLLEKIPEAIRAAS